MSGLGVERVVSIRVSEQRRDRKEDARDSQRRAPLVLQDVQADGAVPVDVGVEHAGGEADLGRLERVVRREVDGEEEKAAGVGGTLGADDGRCPLEKVGADGPGAAVGGRVLLEVTKFLLDALECRHCLNSMGVYRV